MIPAVVVQPTKLEGKPTATLEDLFQAKFRPHGLSLSVSKTMTGSPGYLRKRLTVGGENLHPFSFPSC